MKKLKCFLLFLFVDCRFSYFLQKNCFVGNRAAGTDSYRLDVDNMTGTDCITMEIEAGDILEVYFETLKGSITWKLWNRIKTLYMPVMARA